jgi:threo-3-hydroxy-L-aspartate ammonia-lyase
VSPEAPGVAAAAGNAIALADVRRAAARLQGVAHRTPVLTSRTLDSLLGARVYLKAENLQRTGAFKFRGAYNAISALSPSERGRGVVTFSSGNHAQAVALAGALLGAPAVVVMPADAPAAKLAATRAYGAEVLTYDRYAGDRRQLATSLAEERGLALVPPFDHPDVIAGQGTAALELADQVPELDCLVAPVGGGGLLAGCAVALGALRPRARVYGVEPAAGDDFRRSLEAGRRISIEAPRTIADALQTTAPGALTFEVLQRTAERVVTVEDRQLVDAMTFLFERCKLVAEPGGAAGLAALLAGEITVPGSHVGVIVSGGNVDAQRFSELVQGAR